MSKVNGWEPDVWEPDKGGADDTPVKCYTPDPRSYHEADQSILNATGQRFGLDPVMIPRARRDGRSSAFDPNKAACVHVDPDGRDGGVVVDLRRVTQATMRKALSKTTNPYRVYAALAEDAGLGVTVDAADVAGEPEPENYGVHRVGVASARTGHYETPRSNHRGEQVQRVGTQEHNMRAVPTLRNDGAQILRGIQQSGVAPVVTAPLGPAAVSLAPQTASQPAAQYAEQYEPQSAQPTTAPAQPPLPFVSQPVPQPATAATFSGGATMQQPQQPYYPQYMPPAPQPDLTPLVSALSAIERTVGALSGRIEHLESSRHAPDEPRVRNRVRRLTSEDTATLPVRRRRTATKPIPVDVSADDYDDDDDDGLAQYAKAETRDDKPARARRGDKAERSPERMADLKQRRRAGKKQHLDDIAEKPRDGIIVGFETLHIPFVTGPKPEKARRRVYFEYPGMGRQAANYHAVVAADDVVVLVYDTRYEDGSQFEPPALSPDVVVLLHVSNGAKEATVYRVASMGLTFKLGVLDFVVLLRVRADEFEPAEEA